jgi:hypothetical protein
MTVTISQVRETQPNWFSRKNKRFFGDIQYWVLTGKSGKPYLLRSTFMWSDMFGQPKQVRYRISEIDQQTLKIGSLVDDIFHFREDAKDWIKSH